MHHDRELRAFLGQVRRRWFTQVALRTTGRATGSAAIAGLAGLSISWLVTPEGTTLVLLATATLIAAVSAAAAVIWQVQRRPTDRQVARYVEERVETLPDARPLDDALVSAVEEGGDAVAIRPLLIQAALHRLRGVAPAQIVPASRLRAAAAEALAGAAVLAVVLVLARAPLFRAAETAWVAWFPDAVHVEVLPGDTRVVAGHPITIRAVVHAGDRVLTRFVPSLTVSAGSEQRTVAMPQEGDAFAFGFESVDRTFRYAVSVGSATSREYTVTALFAPRVERIDLEYLYPAFTGMSPRREEDGGDVYAPAGTRVRVRIHTDKPVASGELAFGGAPALGLRREEPRILEADLVLARDDSYRVRLADTDGLRSSGDTEYFIRLVDDRPPDVRILRPAGDQQITPLEEVVIEARADDDHGISRFELVYSVAGGVTRTVPFNRISGTSIAKVGAYLLAAEDLRVQPGDVITYYARAVDIGRGKRPTETKSDMYFLEVRPFGEEFMAAQSQASAGTAGGAQIETLIAAQKEIINATWNIERRSGAGRSAADLKAVADAQAELKARAEQMMSRGGRGRMPFQIPQQVAGGRQGREGRGSDAVGNAIQAMGRAIEHLQGERTKEAIPHEMAALQGLLQAQAEVRRRQVMQQRASGGSGGYGRQGQDLSALFDKELQRQHQTNYESRSQVEERPDQRDTDSALDRIRDLARRQEEISRRLRELADRQLSAEEMKRQLERLMREQTELREQVEELARQTGQQGTQGGDQSQQEGQRSQGQSQQAGQSAGSGERRDDGRSGGNMRDAAEQMRTAASELGRREPGSAADSSARAAQQLRQIEQELRGDSPEVRDRLAGELQLEAQQIADEQRRVAGEAGRLDKGDGAANADARRRLAGEKDRLAERVDALQRGATELAKARPGGAAGAGDRAGRIGDAARELERQQIGRRMRETAREMRDGAGARAAEQGAPRPSQAAEEEIAKALDRVVEHLGGGGAESRNLSAQFDQTRDIRDRLDRLETRIREAEAREQGAAKPPATGAGREGQPGREGRQGAQAEGPGGSGQAAELRQLHEEYGRELQRAREALGKLQQSAPRSGQGGSTPEQHEWSRSAPGNEAFKQDFSRWESLKKEVDVAIEQYEDAVSAQAAKKAAEDRLSAGGSDGVPEAYRKLIARYYEALARARK